MKGRSKELSVWDKESHKEIREQDEDIGVGTCVNRTQAIA